MTKKLWREEPSSRLTSSDLIQKINFGKSYLLANNEFFERTPNATASISETGSSSDVQSANIATTMVMAESSGMNDSQKYNFHVYQHRTHLQPLNLAVNLTADWHSVMPILHAFAQ